MKRPLVVASLMITAIVFIYLKLSLNTLIYEPPEGLDGSAHESTGIVADKGLKVSRDGEIINVIYIKSQEELGKRVDQIECYLDEGAIVPYIGEKVLVNGKVSVFSIPRNPGEFDSRLYYSTQKIAYRMYNTEVLGRNGQRDVLRNALWGAKYRLEGVLDKYLEEGDAAIMKAMLLGDRAFMDEEIKELYKDSGIIHILAVSGLHISIMGVGIYNALKKLKLKPFVYTLVPLVVMYLYGEMCGISSSSFRAICMFSIRLLAPLVGRTYDILSGLALAEILLILDQPLYIYNSGFLFSFGAVVAIAVVRPRLEKMLYGLTWPKLEEMLDGLLSFIRPTEGDRTGKQRESGVLRTAYAGAVSGISVVLVTFPVYLGFYYKYPIYSLITNIIVIPLMGVLIVSGGLCLAAGWLALPGVLVHYILFLYRSICALQNSLPGNTLYIGHAEGFRVVLYYLIIAGALFTSKLRHRDVVRILMIASAFVVISFHPDPELKITAIDVGQGDGILISAGKSDILIDGGSSDKKKVGKYSIIPYLCYEGIGELDAVIVSHEDSDHISGILEIMDSMEKGGIRIKKLILPEIFAGSAKDNYHKLEKRAKELKIPVDYMSTGETMAIGGKGPENTSIRGRGFNKRPRIEFTCLNPYKNMATEGANAYSTVLHMRYGSFTALFTGDVEKEGEEHLKEVLRANREKYGDITLLKVAHHGSAYTTDEELLKLLHPKIALISCGVDNSYGHPHAELLERLEKEKSLVYRTDELGGVFVTVLDRGEVRVSSMLGERSEPGDHSAPRGRAENKKQARRQ